MTVLAKLQAEVEAMLDRQTENGRLDDMSQAYAYRRPAIIALTRVIHLIQSERANAGEPP